jgi:hypothetical protein
VCVAGGVSVYLKMKFPEGSEVQQRCWLPPQHWAELLRHVVIVKSSPPHLFFVGLVLNSGLHACKAETTLEPHFQSILLWLFWRWNLENSLPWLASNGLSSDLGLLSSWDYRYEPPAHS